MKRDDLIKMIDSLSRGIAIHQHHEKRKSMAKDSFKFSRKWYQAHFDSQYYFEVDACVRVQQHRIFRLRNLQ